MSSIGEDEEEPAGGVPDAMSIETIRQGMYRELANEVEGKVYRQMITEKYGKGYFDVQGGHEVMVG